MIEARPQEEESPQDKSSQDNIYNYHRAKLCHGFVLADFNDAVREGDGERVISLYTILLLIFKTHDCTKYAYTTLLLLVKVSALLNRSQSFRLIWNRFCNVIAGLSLRAGGRGFSPATKSLSPGYFDTKQKYWKEKNTSKYKTMN